jgi:hypothetical protein
MNGFRSSMHGVRLSGRIAWLMWLVVHITFMTGFKNRFTALIHWFLCFVGTGRLERAIVGDLDRLVAQNGRRRGDRQGDAQRRGDGLDPARRPL